MSKRRKYPADLKFKIVTEILTGEMSVMDASRHYRIKDSLLYTWRAQFFERGPQLFGSRDAELKQLNEENAELQRKVGELTMDIDFLKKASSALTRRSGRSAS